MINANWIKSKNLRSKTATVFKKSFDLSEEVLSAKLLASARGVYFAEINGERVGDYIMAPGYTTYEKFIQFQSYDVTSLLSKYNELSITLADGWYLGRNCSDSSLHKVQPEVLKRESSVIAELKIKYKSGKEIIISTDVDWQVYDSKIRFSEFYDGEIYDATYTPVFLGNAVVADNNDKRVLKAQLGEKVTEQERLHPVKFITTPCGEKVLDFGQNITGYLEFSVNAHSGDKVSFSFAEIIDKNGNFYNENYRSAKSLNEYICCEGQQIHKPTLNFYGFRYVRIDEYPAEIQLYNFTAIVVHSEMKRTGRIFTSDKYINRLFNNIIWGQKCNFLDIPTDCPQRDERLGWTGDAEVFIKTASYNFNVEKFFTKWLYDMRLAQLKNGIIPSVVPNSIDSFLGTAAWGDAVVICPWQIYLTYGNKSILKKMFPSMKKWVDWITGQTTTKYLWTGQFQYGDWLELGAESGKFKGPTRDEVVASAFYANTVDLLCKIGELLGKDVSVYKILYKNIVSTFKKTYANDLKTQTEYVLALKFGLIDDEKATADALAKLIVDNGTKIKTGFTGTPFILHMLSKYGYIDLAYTLLLKKSYPSWLYPITKGATTMWEHWDGIKPNGQVWSKDMNSFNHYAYGAVADWMYEVAAGINTVESAPGFKEIRFTPNPTEKIDQFGASIDTKYGTVSSRWWHEGKEVRYEIVTPSNATAVINGREYKLTPGKYLF